MRQMQKPLFAGSMLPETEDLTRLGEEIKGYIPAVIGEIVQRSKLSMLSRDAATLCEDDLLAAAFGMKIHAEMVSGKVQEDTGYNDYEQLGRSFAAIMGNGPLAEVHRKLDRIDEQL
jgi:hypothetical protein